MGVGWGFVLGRLKRRIPGGCRLLARHSVNLLFQDGGPTERWDSMTVALLTCSLCSWLG